MPSNTSPRFSRKTLNIIIIMTSIMILMFLNLPGSKPPIEERAPVSEPISEAQNAELFTEEDSSGATLSSIAIIESKPVKSHQIDIETWNTNKGAKVLFVESHEVPMLDIRLVFNAGSARDGNQPGIARFTNAMLNEGTEKYSVDDIAKRFEGLGASFSNGAYRDMAVVSLRSLSDPKFRDSALDMFYEVVAKPNFPEESLERIRKQLLIALERQKQRPGSVASNAFFEHLYGDHPYGIEGGGTTESLPAINKQALIDFHQRYYVASNVVIAIVGDLSKEQANVISQNIDEVLVQGAPAARLPTPQGLTENLAIHKAFPSSQSHVLFGTTSIKRSDPSRYALSVGNEILGGGGFSSRLNQIIRQDKGLAYSVYSYFSAMGAEGPFIMGLQTRNDQREKALAIIKETLEEFVSEGPTQQELDDAKQNIINSFPLSVASNSNMVSNLGAIGFYDLPLDYLDQ
ncbi:MAG: insulinase family protein [Pseudomonadales bacterium]|nr:insulinase family protein [Pseudomonadales bacterium]